jgi:hypothetical protein
MSLGRIFGETRPCIMSGKVWRERFSGIDTLPDVTKGGQVKVEDWDDVLVIDTFKGDSDGRVSYYLMKLITRIY